MSVGVMANVEGLGLDRVGWRLSEAFGGRRPPANERPGIYAIGDVAGVPCLAHKATHEAIVVAEVIAGKSPAPLHAERVPGCTTVRRKWRVLG